MARFAICGCHVTVIGIVLDCINFLIFLFLLGGASFMQSKQQNECYSLDTTLDEKANKRCLWALWVLIFAIVLTLVEIFSTGLLMTAVLYDRGKLVIVPLVITYLNILDALIFSILAILDACNQREMGEYIVGMFVGDDEPQKDAIMAVSIALSSLLVVALVFCIFNTFIHTRIWQYYKAKSEEDDWISETTSQISIIATFSMDMVYDEWKKKEEGRTITSIKEEDEDEEEKEDETAADLW